ncbi:response regulator transcription factor [Variovorax sp. LT2P21]|uniref:response regulator transcription factor n=1 Tax=Variovorax sp. LT2P21 TaxID=3443731 RepID=UPI003F46B318
MHIALVEDDDDQRELLELWLTGDGRNTVASFGTAAALCASLATGRFDILILDWFLPDATGAQVLDWVRQHLSGALPVIVVTAREDEATVVAALAAGADDYVVKPPKPLELLARIEAVVRRAQPSGTLVLRVGVYEIDIAQRRLFVDNVPVALTQKEFDLAVYVFQNPAKLFTRDHLLSRIWGLDADIDTRTVDTHVSRLRKKLRLDGSTGWKLASVHGVGYRFDRAESFVEPG